MTQTMKTDVDVDRLSERLQAMRKAAGLTQEYRSFRILKDAMHEIVGGAEVPINVLMMVDRGFHMRVSSEQVSQIEEMADRVEAGEVDVAAFADEAAVPATPAEPTEGQLAELGVEMQNVLDLLLRQDEAMAPAQVGTFTSVLETVSDRIEEMWGLTGSLTDEEAFTLRQVLERLGIFSWHLINAVLASRVPDEEWDEHGDGPETSNVKRVLSMMRKYYESQDLPDVLVEELVPPMHTANRRVQIHRLWERTGVNPMQELPFLSQGHYYKIWHATYLDDEGRVELLRKAHDRGWKPAQLKHHIDEQLRRRRQAPTSNAAESSESGSAEAEPGSGATEGGDGKSEANASPSPDDQGDQSEPAQDGGELRPCTFQSAWAAYVRTMRALEQEQREWLEQDAASGEDDPEPIRQAMLVGQRIFAAQREWLSTLQAEYEERRGGVEG